MTTPSPLTAAAPSEDRSAAADVLVVFGITGDLARVMTFLSLYRLELRGLLDCPVVGVAVDDWSLEQLVQRARDSIVAKGEDLDEEVFARFTGRLSYVQGDFADDATYQRVAEAIAGREHPVFYLEVPPFLFATVVKGLSGAGLTADGQGRGREALRARPGVRQGAGGRAAPVRRRVAAAADRPLPREDGLRGDPVPALRQHGPRAAVEPQPRRVRADHDGRGLRGRGPRSLLRPGGCPARRRGQPPDAGGRGRGDGAPVGPWPEALRDAQVALFRSVKDADPAHYVRGQHDGYRDSRASPRTRRPRRTSRCAWRSTTGGGRACRSTSAPESG